MAEMVRVDEGTHAKLRGLAEKTGEPMTALLARAVEELEERVFWGEFHGAVAALRADPAAWAEEQAERAGWESLNDGLRDEPPYPVNDDGSPAAR